MILRGIIELLFYWLKSRTYYKVNGVVVRNHKSSFYDNSVRAGYDHYYPIIRFTDKNGVEKEVVSNLYNADRPLYSVGTNVTVLLSHKDSDRMVIDEKADKYYAPILWISLGVVSIIVVFFFFK